MYPSTNQQITLNGRAGKIPAVSELLSHARKIGELARDKAAETEANRRVSDETAETIKQAGLFRVLQPVSRGGYGLTMDVLIELSALIGRGCGSTAWVYGISSVHQWFVASMLKEAQDEFWDNPDAIAAGSYPPVGKTVAVDGGYKITGSWAFSSGCDIASWYFLGTLAPPTETEPAPTPVFLLVPRTDVKLDDNWHTMGLAGTGSKNIVADDLFVPAHRALKFSDMINGTGPGLKINTEPFYRQSFLSVLPSALVAPVLGMAEGALEDFISAVKVRDTRGAVAGGNRKMAEFGSIQTRVADAAASIDAARLMLHNNLKETYAVAEQGEFTPMDMRLRNRRDHAFTMRLLVGAVDTLFAATGGQGIYLEKPMQRVWRDAHAASSHISVNWDAVSTMYGQYVLGLEPKGQF